MTNTQQSQPAPQVPGKRSPYRGYLTWLLIVFLVLLGSIMIWRRLTNNTAGDQRIAAQHDQDEKRLAASAQGNPGEFSARQEKRLREIQEADSKKAGEGGNTTPAAASNSISGTAAPGSGTGAQSGSPAGQGTRAPMPTGTPPADDEYDRRRQEVARQQARKMGVYERDRGGQGGVAQAIGTNPQVQQIAALLAANSAGSGSGATAGAASQQQAVAELLKAQQGLSGTAATAPDAKDQRFLEQQRESAERNKRPAEPLRATQGPGSNSILQGTSIEIQMRSAVSTDKPGDCRAAVEHDVYDSVTQSKRLIPAGTTVLCKYNSDVAAGQESILIAFTRMIFPNGASVMLTSFEGADPTGVVGAPAEVNNRFWKIYGTSFMVAAISAFAERSNSNTGVTINISGGQVLSSAATQALADVSRRALERNINIKPELRLKQGDRIRVIVTNDMVLDPQITGVRP